MSIPTAIDDESGIRPGDFYEDGFFHPCVCMGIDSGCAWGISLIDGSHPRMSDLLMGGARKLTLEEAWRWKQLGPARIEQEHRQAASLSGGSE